MVGGSCGVGYVSLLGGTWGDLEELNLEIMFWDLGLTEWSLILEGWKWLDGQYGICKSYICRGVHG